MIMIVIMITFEENMTTQNNRNNNHVCVSVMLWNSDGDQDVRRRRRYNCYYSLQHFYGCHNDPDGNGHRNRVSWQQDVRWGHNYTFTSSRLVPVVISDHNKTTAPHISFLRSLSITSIITPQYFDARQSLWSAICKLLHQDVFWEGEINVLFLLTSEWVKGEYERRREVRRGENWKKDAWWTP